MSARILDLNTGGSRIARMCTAAFSWARRGPVTIPDRAAAGLGPDDLMPELAARVRLLEQTAARWPGRRFEIATDPAFAPIECSWCRPERERITSVRVWGDPDLRRPDVFRPLDVVAVCLQCALGTPGCGGRGPRLGALGQALAELRLGGLVRIEVCE
ncbi:hypothetical protein SAMN04489727_1690 [Amycolatopsis tolypomycina]|uniref:Uncharacterized protein n=1 Tax=Amycolatopsis tolypomycina TaxID=208445 RepID=A0A1H4JAC2_9PSEU|nr:hypothetical protein [Amycolatopsis tolypomycina]SEB43181.1 hypothetical protein SAMN04489727_1690 [Amycolatopsis tolypomycina]